MKTVVFSDVHGNLPALEAMLAEAGPADRYVCLGDVVNYGPWSNECVERIGSLPHCERLMGNHDRAFLDGAYPGTHPVARAFFEFCFPRFRNRALLADYKESCLVGVYCAQHTLDERYIFADTPVQLERSYLIGHSHHQFVRESNGHRLVNVGSAGQNRRDLHACNYAVHGPGAADVRLAACHYDAGLVIARMRELGYPSLCCEYYLAKMSRGSHPSSPIS